MCPVFLALLFVLQTRQCSCTLANECSPYSYYDYHFDLHNCYPCRDLFPNSVECQCVDCRSFLNIEGHYVPTKCADGYYLNGNSCDTCAPQCSTCSGESWNCTACINGMLYLENTCITSNCKILEGTHCKECYEGFYFSPNGVCTACTSPCLICSGKDSCDYCPHFFTNRNGTCVPQYCKTVAKGACIECDAGYALSNSSSNSLVCQKCQQGCALCSNLTGCDVCEVGYSRVNGSCAPTNCQAATEAVCTTCNTGYYLNRNNTCSSCPLSCVSCSGPLGCFGCNPGWTFDKGRCLLAHCAEPNGSVCARCDNASYLTFEKHCVQCPEGCVSCNATQCIACSPGWDLKNGSCHADNCIKVVGIKCEECKPGYYVSAADECMRCPALCTACNGTACTMCVAVAELSAGKCILPHCNTASGSLCTACDSGYYINAAGLCSACTANCQQCSSSTSCDICVAKYYAVGTLCMPLHCTRLMGGSCAECMAGFYLDLATNTCNLCQATCTTCANEATSCTSCSAPYTLVGSTCSILNCKTSNGTLCGECALGYFLTNNGTACLPCDAACSSCVGFASNCTACHSKYTLSGSLCVLPNCETMTGTACNKCRTNYYADSDGASCRRCAATCMTCAGAAGACTSCFQGYTLNATTNSCVLTSCSGSQILFEGACYMSFCGQCLNGTCKLNKTSNAFNCFCRSNDMLSGLGNCVANTMKSTLSKGSIAGIVIIVLVAVAAIIAIPVVVHVKNRMIRRIVGTTRSGTAMTPTSNIEGSLVL